MTARTCRSGVARAVAVASAVWAVRAVCVAVMAGSSARFRMVRLYLPPGSAEFIAAAAAIHR
ncbi:hypothetical protein GCM10023205_55310 [Yinghuangia aomiensis]|uniref:Secreted protein n=1 Tax=Yinghuangia aomiensis TaxID=676205 RepID=A0ABP9HVA4_9ACTN